MSIANFYLQDTRTIVGNDMMWWAIDGKGYTSDLDKAHVFTWEDALERHKQSPHFKPWPKDYIDQRVRPACDIQYVNFEDTGIKLPKTKQRTRPRRKVENCPNCGRFLDHWQCVVGCDNCKSNGEL